MSRLTHLFKIVDAVQVEITLSKGVRMVAPPLFLIGDF